MWDIGTDDAHAFCDDLWAAAEVAGLQHEIAGLTISHSEEAVMISYLKGSTSAKEGVAQLGFGQRWTNY